MRMVVDGLGSSKNMRLVANQRVGLTSTGRIVVRTGAITIWFFVPSQHDHKAICEYKTLRCSLGCGKRIPLGKLKKHEQEECPFRKMQCPHCTSEMLAGDYDVRKYGYSDLIICYIKDHLFSCPNAPYACNHCHIEMPRSEVSLCFIYQMEQ